MEASPIIALTQGDPAGIGPEIIVKAFQDGALSTETKVLVIGDLQILKKKTKQIAPEIQVHSVNSPREGLYQPGTIDIIDLNNVSENLRMGQASLEGGKASYEAINKAVTLALKDEVDAITTCPINKKSLHLAGHLFPGHTELLGQLTNSKEPTLMMESNSMRVVLVTTHLPLDQVKSQISKEKVLQTIRTTHDWLKKYVTEIPRVSVVGLNPHCGDGGIFGKEETEFIVPALKLAQKEGIKVSGPYPADALFARGVSDKYDAVICMYHDQGMIPVKMNGMGVNITLGLPILRTSVDHGTAYDIVGENKASADNLKLALKTAGRLSQSTLSMQ
ncbi:MAG: 4-hydroxythreonine-4-phosphate dehydrogenase PdxA [Nitrospinota bacterium]|nr:4-hydroxythreonine-4-phosphate dehydrogenase PdxA [Nitrospinota bacterium]